MAVMAVMGRFFMQLILCKEFGGVKIAESLAESAFSGFFQA